MNWHINWQQPSTHRGLFGIIAGTMSIWFLFNHDLEKALGVMTIASIVKGYLGFGAEDNP